MIPHVVCFTSDCSKSTDNFDRFVYDCSGHYFGAFPSDIPKNTLVLLLRRTMKSPTVPSFQSIGLNKLQVLDLSWNSINKFSNDTFKDMTLLLSLDIRGNFVFEPVVPVGLFSSLIKLRTLQVEGAQFTLESTINFLEVTKSLKSLDSFVFYGGDVKFGIYIASQLTNLTSLEFRMCFNPELFSLAQLFHRLRNLTQLQSIAIVHCYLSNVGNMSFDGINNLKNINLGCNYLNIGETIRFLGSQSSLFHLDTLIMDRIDMTRNIIDRNEFTFNSNIFCNLSFSSSLRRLSIQQVKLLYFEAAMFRCLQNLQSISLGHNMFIDILDDGRLVEQGERLSVTFKWSKSLYYIKISSVLTVATTKETYCHAEDNTFDQYFIDENVLQKQSTVCESGSLDIQHGYIKVPSCLRALQVDHIGLSSDYGNSPPPLGIRVSSNNSLELLDFSYSVFNIDGLFINALTISGLSKLRIVKLRHMNIKRLYMVTLNHAENLYDVDLSDNRFEQMTAKQLSQMFAKPLNIYKLNLSACDIIELNSDFLRQFPQIAFLDLSYNKLSYVSFNFSWLISNVSLIIDLSFNQISVIKDSFVESIKLLELLRPITLKLNNNQFRCDCDTVNFIRWFQQTNYTVVFENKNDITCIYRGINALSITSIDVENLEFQCTQYLRILYISIGSMLCIAIICLLSGIVLFQYRWHVRWYWYHVQRKIQKLRAVPGYASLAENKSYICYINYFGVSDQWIMTEMVSRIRDWNVGEVFLFQKNVCGGLCIADAIIEAIESSSALLYVIGNDHEAGEVQTFHRSLELASIERSSDLMIVDRDLVTFKNLQERMPILKYLSKPNRKHPLKTIQFKDNDMFWNELKQFLRDIQRTN